MKYLRFIAQFFFHPKTVGAILPSSRFLSYKMIENIHFEKANCIVEYGPGTGVFTEQLLQNRREQTKLILIENNERFYWMLKEKYKEEANVYIINGSAENLENYLEKCGVSSVDYVVSGLPFASLPIEVSNKILASTSKALKKDGKFITFQYTNRKKKLIHQFFPEIKVKREVRNFPPAYVFCCTKQ